MSRHRCGRSAVGWHCSFLRPLCRVVVWAMSTGTGPVVPDGCKMRKAT